MKLSQSQRGVYSVEFVLVAGFFFLLLFSIMEMGKVMFYFNTANEATRSAARLAAVCDKNDDAITSAVTSRLPFLEAEDVTLTYLPDDCTRADCKTITVSLAGATYTSSIFGFNVNIPNFSTTIPRESMDSSINSNCS